MQVAVRVVPNSRKSKVVGWEPAADDCIGHDRMLRIKLNAPPVDGKANRELLQFLSHLWGIRTNEMRLISGEKGPTKVVRIETEQDLPADFPEEAARSGQPLYRAVGCRACRQVGYRGRINDAARHDSTIPDSANLSWYRYAFPNNAWAAPFVALP